MAGVKGKSGGPRLGAGRPRRHEGPVRRKALAVRRLPKAAAHADDRVLGVARAALGLVLELTTALACAQPISADLVALFRFRAERALASLPKRASVETGL